MNGPALLALQHLDSALDHVEHRRQRLAEHGAVADARAALKAHREQLEHVLARIDEAQAVIDEAEHDGDELTAKRTSLEAKLKTVIAPREAEALMHEIATINARRDATDERELEALEAQADANEARIQLEEGLPPLERAVADAQAALQAAEADLNRERDEFLAQRGVAAEALTADEHSLYERKRTQHHGVGIATLDGRNCTGCHLGLSPAEIDEVRATAAAQLAECPQCSRILVV